MLYGVWKIIRQSTTPVDAVLGHHYSLRQTLQSQLTATKSYRNVYLLLNSNNIMQHVSVDFELPGVTTSSRGV